MGVIYIVEQLDFSIEEDTQIQDVSLIQIGYVTDEEKAVSKCKELESERDKSGRDYKVDGEVGLYPRYTYQEIKELK